MAIKIGQLILTVVRLVWDNGKVIHICSLSPIVLCLSSQNQLVKINHSAIVTIFPCNEIGVRKLFILFDKTGLRTRPGNLSEVKSDRATYLTFPTLPTNWMWSQLFTVFAMRGLYYVDLSSDLKLNKTKPTQAMLIRSVWTQPNKTLEPDPTCVQYSCRNYVAVWWEAAFFVLVTSFSAS